MMRKHKDKLLRTIDVCASLTCIGDAGSSYRWLFRRQTAFGFTRLGIFHCSLEMACATLSGVG